MKKNTLLYLCLILTLYLLPNQIYALGNINNEKIKEIVQNNQGQSALVTKQSGEIVAGYNNNVNPNYGGASTVKLIVADIIISRFNQGTIKLDDTISIPSCVRPGEELNKGSWVVRDAMRNMLKDSGNSSTNALIYSVTKSCDAKGMNNLLGNYSNTKINIYLNLPGASPVLGSAGGNTTNANDVSKAMSRIFTSSGEAANIAKTSLQSSTDKLGINSTANKVGITSRVTGNVAIVEIGGNKYIVTVFVDGNNEAKVTTISNDIIKILNENKDSLTQSNSPSTTDSTSSTGASTSTSGAPVSYESYTNFPGVGRISSLCQLIIALWYLGFAVLLTSVFGMFLWGGYIYVTAGVNAGQVNQAKEIFTNTITGLIIGLSIFIIINIINPGLLQGNCSIPSVGSGATVGGGGGVTPLSGDCKDTNQSIWKCQRGGCGDSYFGLSNVDKQLYPVITEIFKTCSSKGNFQISSAYRPWSSGSFHQTGKAVDFADGANDNFTLLPTGKCIMDVAKQCGIPASRVNPGTDANQTFHVHIDLGR